jgi:signal transduction histidine kinase
MVEVGVVLFPIADMILLCIVLLLADRLGEYQNEVAFILITLSTLILTITDLILSYQTLKGLFSSGGILDTGWQTARLLLGLAGVIQAYAVTTGSNFEIDHPRIFAFTLRLRGVFPYFPYLWMIAAYALLIQSFLSPISIGLLLLSIGVGCIIGLVIARQIITQIENNRLYQELQQAMQEIQYQTISLVQSNKDLQLEILERRHMEKLMVQSEKLASLGTLAAGIAHEINSPLQVITGISESLMVRVENEDMDRAQFKTQLKTLNRNGWRIAEIVKSLLRYARATPEGMEHQDLNNIVKTTTRLMEHQLASWSNILVEMDLAPTLAPLYCNQGQMGQVLINLLTNARDAMPNGGTITIRTGVDDKGNRIFLQVSDTGEGIPQEIRSRIFDPFFTTKPIGLGTGLGLSILSGIVRAHGGDIEVESQEKIGTTFTLYFPSPGTVPHSRLRHSTETSTEMTRIGSLFS